jgi:hypothetical protein
MKQCLAFAVFVDVVICSSLGMLAKRKCFKSFVIADLMFDISSFAHPRNFGET